MAVIGCTNPAAANYNAAADTENYSCQYLFKANGQCHLFTDVQPAAIADTSFTLSYSIKDDSWVFFHDYLPDMYMHTREQLYTLKNNSVYKHNDGPPGIYYNPLVAKPFFIDVVFAGPGDMLLESVSWVTEYINSQGTDAYFGTLTHLTLWNSIQHTDRIPIQQIADALAYDNTRRTKGEWTFNDFRDVLIENAGDFLFDIFTNFALNPAKVNTSRTWYTNGPLEDKWFCVRFEFDNSTSGKLILHDTGAAVLKQNR